MNTAAFTLIDSNNDSGAIVHANNCGAITTDYQRAALHYGHDHAGKREGMTLEEIADYMGAFEIADEYIEDGDNYGREVVWQLEDHVKVCKCASAAWEEAADQLAKEMPVG